MPAIIENVRGADSVAVLPESLNVLKPVIINDLVRIGNSHDGGYVIAGRVIPQADCLLSFGMSDDWTFEEDFHHRHPQCLIHSYDYSVGKRHFYRQVRRAIKKTLLLKQGSRARLQKAWKTYRDYGSFFSGNRIHFEERIFSRMENPNDATMGKIFSRIPNAAHTVVKMDIEGGEYRVIQPLLDFQEKIDLIVIEFHDTETYRQTFLHCVRQILEQYQIIHVHGNNAGIAAADGLPDILEMTFMSRRFQTEGVHREQLPLAGVDFPNFPERRDFVLRFRSA